MIVLFYSQQCQHSKNVIMTIQKSSIQNDIKMFCIDGFQPLPSYLTHVPTLKIYPSTLLIGDEIIEWLEKNKPREEIRDQIANSTGDYTMLDDNTSNINEMDTLFNSRISTPGGQMPSKDGPSTSSGPSFPQTEKLQSSNIDMAFENLMAQREKDIPNAVKTI